MDTIINKVAQSALEVFDLEDYYPEGTQTQIDLSIWLLDGFLLIEKEFRNHLKNHDWTQYQNQHVALFCSTEAIYPAWATLLITMQLTPYTKSITYGKTPAIAETHYQNTLSKIDFSIYHNKAVILKGCAKKPVPMTAYVLAAQKLQPHAKSIMYGEACSAVPLFKKAKI